MEMEAALSLVDRLIAAVGRAFYSDTTVVILDVLTREAYLCHEEIAPRLKLAHKDVQKALNQLESEMLIRTEDVLMDDLRNSKCYYIDYQLFVNVVRFRVHCMQEEFKSVNRTGTQRIWFQCPTCQSKWSDLEVQKSISKDQKFVCSNCCPSDNLGAVVSEPSFRLQMVDTQGKLQAMQSLEAKMNIQMNSNDLHDGIYDLLRRLKNVVLPNNRPSTNIKCGYSSSAITNAETRKQIEETAAKFRGNIQANKKNTVESRSLNKDALGRTFELVIEDDGGGSVQSSSSFEGKPVSKRAKIESASVARVIKSNVVPRPEKMDTSQPAFLQNSHVMGTQKVLDTVAAMQQERSNQNEIGSVGGIGFVDALAGTGDSVSSSAVTDQDEATLLVGSLSAADGSGGLAQENGEDEEDEDDEGVAWTE